MKGRHYTADQQAPNLAILLSNKLGERMYSTIAPMMGLPLARQAQRLRAADCCSIREYGSTLYVGMMPGKKSLAAESTVVLSM